MTTSPLTRIRNQFRRDRDVDETQAAFVCHCKHVSYGTVERAIRRGAKSMADIQRSTSACTRCFGCRFELEGMLKDAYGDAYRHEATITLPAKLAKVRAPRPMYMPVLAGFRGSEVDTRVIVFNWEGPEEPIGFRADLLSLDGRRLQAAEHTISAGCSVVLDFTRGSVGELLPGGVGVVKLVLDTEEVGSLRPYFHLSTPNGITSTHEKKGPSRPEHIETRDYHWIFPVGSGPRRQEEAYFFMTNTQTTLMEDQRLVWQGNDGSTESTDVPTLEFSQSACIPLHEYLPGLNGGAGGTVRLEPAMHAIAGFMIRYEPEVQLWRVQHL